MYNYNNLKWIQRSHESCEHVALPLTFHCFCEYLFQVLDQDAGVISEFQILFEIGLKLWRSIKCTAENEHEIICWKLHGEKEEKLKFKSIAFRANSVEFYFQCLLARNYYKIKNLGAVLSFFINIVLLFCRVSSFSHFFVYASTNGCIISAVSSFQNVNFQSKYY